jgi:hypothetical protein
VALLQLCTDNGRQTEMSKPAFPRAAELQLFGVIVFRRPHGGFVYDRGDVTRRKQALNSLHLSIELRDMFDTELSEGRPLCHDTACCDFLANMPTYLRDVNLGRRGGDRSASCCPPNLSTISMCSIPKRTF